MEGRHRLGGTDRSLLWGTAALIAFTLGAVTVARMDGGEPRVVTERAERCHNSAGVASACLPPAPATTPQAAPSPVPATAVMSPAPASTPAVTSPAPAASPPVAKPQTRAASVRPTTAASTTAPATWAVGVAYRTGARVAYTGGVYACVQAHTSQPDWPPTATPALWSLVSGA